MLNPRNIYIQALDQLPILASKHKDYFNTAGMVESFEHKDKVKRLVSVLSGAQKDGQLLKCFDLFNNINRRVFFEGILFHFTKEEILTLPDMDESFITCYTTYFFSLNGFKGFANRNDYLSRLENESAKGWYQDLSVRTINDVRFRMTGKSEEKIDILDSLKEVYKKNLNLFNTFSTTDPQKLKLYTDIGMFSSDKTVFDVAFKASANLIKIGELLLKNDKDNKEDFLASWGIEVIGNDAATFFEQKQTEEVEDDLFKLMKQVNPVSDDGDRRVTSD